jgi:HD-GYP domain-containing protein (c-di-GMP phosphodiesterase class II)
MKKHSEVGYRIAQSTTQLAPIADAILHHHERWDGNGYPYGISKDKIPLISRIISIVDTFDAITNNRPYREKRSREIAFKEIKNGSESQFDPKLVDSFIDHFYKLNPEQEVLQSKNLVYQ